MIEQSDIDELVRTFNGCLVGIRMQMERVSQDLELAEHMVKVIAEAAAASRREQTA